MMRIMSICMAWVFAISLAEESDSMLQNSNVAKLRSTDLVKNQCPDPGNKPCHSWSLIGLLQANMENLFQGTLQKFEVSNRFDEDKAWLFESNGHCAMAFLATTSDLDWVNNMNWTVVNKWGVDVHAGVANELEGLVHLMNFDEIRLKCSGSFSVIGLSLGGALAQLFSVLLTRKDDPLSAGLQLYKLYTFGAYASTPGVVINEQAKDGCFDGAQYWYVQKHPTKGMKFAVDTIASNLVGAHVHDPIRSDKVLVRKNGLQSVYPCGLPLPANMEDLYEFLQKKGKEDQWLKLHTSYGEWLNCQRVQ